MGELGTQARCQESCPLHGFLSLRGMPPRTHNEDVSLAANGILPYYVKEAMCASSPMCACAARKQTESASLSSFGRG